MYENVSYSIERIGAQINVRQSNKQELLASIFVDATDSRLTIKYIDKNIPLEAVQALTNDLDSTFGGKQIFIVPEKARPKFAQCGFISNPSANSRSERLRETDILKLASINSPEFPDLTLVSKEDIKITDEANILELMKNSEFSPSKIAQYEKQDITGIRLMLEYSIVFGLRNKAGNLVALCRVTDLGDGNYYLGDTLTVKEHREDLTKLIYKKIGETIGKGRILLIAPPERVNEFEKQYGCTVPNDIMVKFADAPKLELEKETGLDQVFREEKERIQAKYSRTNILVNKV